MLTGRNGTSGIVKTVSTWPWSGSWGRTSSVSIASKRSSAPTENVNSRLVPSRHGASRRALPHPALLSRASRATSSHVGSIAPCRATPGPVRPSPVLSGRAQPCHAESSRAAWVSHDHDPARSLTAQTRPSHVTASVSSASSPARRRSRNATVREPAPMRVSSRANETRDPSVVSARGEGRGCCCRSRRRDAGRGRSDESGAARVGSRIGATSTARKFPKALMRARATS